MKPINIPAIRGELGTLVYYTAIFTFKQVAERVRAYSGGYPFSISGDIRSVPS